MMAAMAVIPTVMMITVPESCDGASLVRVTGLPFNPTTCSGGGGGGGGLGGGPGGGGGEDGSGGGDGGSQPVGRPSFSAWFT